MNLPERLKAQNNGQAWRDCEYAGLRHRLVEDQRVGNHVYFRCTRPSCRVTIMRTEAQK